MVENCSYCGKEFSSIPFSCKFCGFVYCLDHHLPENHSCHGLEKYKEKQIESLKQGEPDRPVEYFHQKWKKPQFRIFYYVILIAITLIAIFAIVRTLS